MYGKLYKRLISLTVVLSLFAPATFQVARAEKLVSKTEVNFGAVYPITGSLSPGANSYFTGIKTYFSYVNESGGVHGRKLNLLERDSQGRADKTVAASNGLFLGDKVFGFLSSAPTCTTHIAFLQALRLDRQGLSDILSDCSFSSFVANSVAASYNLLANTTYNKLDIESENLILMKYIDDNLSDKRIALIYENSGRNSVTKISSDRIICKRAFVPDVEAKYILNCNSSSLPLRNGDLVIYNGGAAGLVKVISEYVAENLTLTYFTNYDAYNPKAFTAYGKSGITSLAEIYTVSTNSLVSDLGNESVSTFLSIAEKYAKPDDVNQHFLNGMNSGYLVANVVGAVGAELTRGKFQQALLQFGNQFDALGLSDRSNLANLSLAPTGGVVVKNLGNSNEVVSDLFVVSDGVVSKKPIRVASINAKGLPASKQLFITPTPTPKPQNPKTPKPLWK
jgi:hypothetical protein